MSDQRQGPGVIPEPTGKIGTAITLTQQAISAHEEELSAEQERLDGGVPSVIDASEPQVVDVEKASDDSAEPAPPLLSWQLEDGNVVGEGHDTAVEYGEAGRAVGPRRLLELAASWRPVVRYRITHDGTVEVIHPGAARLEPARHALARVISAWIQKEPGLKAFATIGDWVHIRAFESSKEFERFAGSLSDLGTDELRMLVAMNKSATVALRGVGVELPSGDVIQPSILFHPAYPKAEPRYTRAAARSLVSRTGQWLPEGFDAAAFQSAERERQRGKLKSEKKRASRKAL